MPTTECPHCFDEVEDDGGKQLKCPKCKCVFRFDDENQPEIITIDDH